MEHGLGYAGSAGNPLLSVAVVGDEHCQFLVASQLWIGHSQSTALEVGSGLQDNFCLGRQLDIETQVDSGVAERRNGDRGRCI